MEVCVRGECERGVCESERSVRGECVRVRGV